MKVWRLLLCFSLVLATSARAQQAASTAEQTVSEARARIAEAEAFACDLQDKACLSQELIMRSDNDQWIRGLLGPLCGYRSECDLWPMMDAIDTLNARRIHQVLRVHGWPSGEGWGPEVELAMFHIVQHLPHNDPAQTNWRPLVLEGVRQSAEQGRLPGVLYAKMYDRIEAEAGRLQRYGTQSFCRLGEDAPTCHLLPLESPNAVNALRADLGMEPLTAEAIAGARDDN